MTTEFNWSKRSLNELAQVHPLLRELCDRALELSPYDFMITDGGRTIEEQRHYVAVGASQTMHSNHLIQSDGYAYAIDFAVIVNGKVRWEEVWYKPVADAFKEAAKQLSIHIVWGGDWVTFKDGPHIELDRKFYPRQEKTQDV